MCLEHTKSTKSMFEKRVKTRTILEVCNMSGTNNNYEDKQNNRCNNSTKNNSQNSQNASNTNSNQNSQNTTGTNNQKNCKDSTKNSYSNNR